MSALDVWLFRWINAGTSAPHWLVGVAAFISDSLPLMLVLLFAIAALFKPTWRRPFALCALSMILVWLAVRGIRALYPMPRPAALGIGMQWAEQGRRPGFPSMHASVAFAMAASLWVSKLRAPALIATVFALLTAWSRLLLGLHFPSDVLAAAVLGIIVAGLATALLRLAINRRGGTGAPGGGP